MKMSNYMMNFIHRFNKFSYKLFNYTQIPVMILRNQGQAMVGIFLRLIPAIGGTSSKYKVAAVKQMLYTFNKIAKTQGLPGLVKYLKTSCVLLQQYLGGYHISDISSIGPRVSRTKSGLPRILPKVVRYSIRLGSTFWVRMSLSIMSVFRAIVYPGKLKISTITNPYSGEEMILKEIIAFIPKFLKAFVRRPLGKHLLGPMKVVPISKSSPTSRSIQDSEGNFDDTMSMSTSPLSVLTSLRSLSESQVQSIMTLSYLDDKVGAQIRAMLKSTCLSSVWSYSTREFASIPWNEHVNQGTVTLANRRFKIGQLPDRTGKLGLKQEAAGKIRVFAMVDPFTQFVMSPLHKGIFSVLRRNSLVDGTFDQLAPLARAWKSKTLFSMDLSSATDRLPIRIQTPLIQSLFQLTNEQAQAWESLLVGRDYWLQERPNSPRVPIRYSVGQPMGALSSWAMLALSHHLIVQFCAVRCKVVRPGKMFKGYAVLGDDIVIYHPKVAKTYHKVLTLMGVECNLAKSVMSPKGTALEFAKKTFWKGVNVSPIPLLELFSALKSPTALSQFAKDHNLSLAQAMRVAGFGYRVLGGLQRPLSKQNLKVRYFVMSSWIHDPDLLIQSFKTLVPWLDGLRMNEFFKEFCSSYVEYLLDKIEKLRVSVSQIYNSAELSYMGFRGPFPPGMVPLDIAPDSIKRDLYYIYTFIFERYKDKYHDLLFKVREICRGLNLYVEQNSSIPVTTKAELEEVLLQWMKIIVSTAAAEAELSTLSLKSLQVMNSDPVRLSDPKMFKLHSVFLSQLGFMSKLSKTKEAETPLSPSTYMYSSFIPFPRTLLLRRFLNPSLIKRVLIRACISRIKWLGGWTTLIGSMTYFFGVAETFTCFIGIWGLLTTLIGGSMTTGSWFDSVWYYGCNILLHSIELFLATLIVANLYKWQVTSQVIDILYQNYERGFTSLYDSLRIFYNYQTNVLLDLAYGRAVEAATYVAHSIQESSFLSQMGVGMLGTLIFTWFVRWFFGI